jgi:hypothetical protein
VSPSATRSAGARPSATRTPSAGPFPTAAPATGGGGTAGFQDAWLLGLGGVSILAGAGCIAYRTRRIRNRDVTFGEDASTARAGTVPRVTAALRNLVISILRLAGHTSIARSLRHAARNPARAFRLLTDRK